MIAAILKAQLLSMRIGASRGSLFSVITAVFWYGLWAMGAAAVYAGAAHASRAQLDGWLPAGFLAVCGYWQLVPVLSASMGAGLDMRKLLIYPLPHGKLFQVELLLRLATGAELLMVLVAGTLGLLRNPQTGGWKAFPGLGAAVVIFVLFNLLLASGVRSLLERLLSRRKVREVLGILLVLLYVAPRLLISSGARPGKLAGLVAAAGVVGLPWTAAARAGLPPGGNESRWPALAVLSGWTLAALWFGRAQFERNLRYDAMAAQATPLGEGTSRVQTWKERFYRLPSLVWRDPLAGIVEKELRSLARTPRFRMVFIMGFSFGLIVWLPISFGTHAGNQPSVIAEHYLTIVSVYALTLLGQVSYLNTFGFDRSAAQIYFSAPVSMARSLASKNIAVVLLMIVEMLAVTLASFVLRIRITVESIVEAFVVTAIVAAYLLAMGNLSSVHFPRAMNPERVSQGGAANRMQALIFLFYPIALLPVFLAFWARQVFQSEIFFSAILAFAAVLGAVVYWISMDSAVNTVVQRREKILMELTRGEGPVATE